MHLTVMRVMHDKSPEMRHEFDHMPEPVADRPDTLAEHTVQGVTS